MTMRQFAGSLISPMPGMNCHLSFASFGKSTSIKARAYSFALSNCPTSFANNL